MNPVDIIVLLLVGAIAGWLAGQMMKGQGFGLVGNIVVGVIGSFIGSWLFNQLAVSLAWGFVGDVITAFFGALVLLFVIGLVRRK